MLRLVRLSTIARLQLLLQASYDGAEGAEVKGSDEPAVEPETAELIEEKVRTLQPHILSVSSC